MKIDDQIGDEKLEDNVNKEDAKLLALLSKKLVNANISYRSRNIII